MVKLIGFLTSYLIEGFAIWIYADLFRARFKPGIRILCLIIGCLTLSFIGTAGVVWLNASLYAAFLFFFFGVGYKAKWYVALFHSVFLTAVMSLIELVTLVMIYGIAPNFLESEDILINEIFAVTSKIPFLLLCFAIVSIRKIIKLKEETAKSAFLYLLVPVSSMVSMLVFLDYLDRYEVSARLKWATGFATLSILFSDLILLGVYLYNQNRNSEYIRLKLTLAQEKSRKEYYELLQEQNENQRILVHDIKDHLQSIEALNAQGERAKIDEYIKSLYEAANLKSVVRVSENELLNVVVLRYRKECEAQGIPFHVDIRRSSMDFLDDYEITSLFANLLDNAMEAVHGVEGAFIDLNVDRKEGTAFSVIHIINTCAEDPFEGEKTRIPFSRKKEPGHGYGLKSVEKVVQKHDGNMNLYFDGTKHVFHTIIILNNRI